MENKKNIKDCLAIKKLVEEPYLVEKCFLDREDNLCINFKKKSSIKQENKKIIVNSNYWRLEKDGKPLIGSTDESVIIPDYLSILVGKILIDFSINSFLDLSLNFNKNFFLFTFSDASLASFPLRIENS